MTTRIAFSDAFGIAFIGAAVAALAASAVVAIYSGGLLPAILVYGLSSVTLQPGFLGLVLLFNHVLSKSLAQAALWLLLPLGGVAWGLVLTLLVLYPGPVTGVIGGSAGLVGGIVCASLWGFVRRYRARNPVAEEASGRNFFYPSWLGGTKTTKATEQKQG